MLLHVADGGISPQGTFWFFAAVTILGGFWVWFAMPETAGRSLESMDRLFSLPWYKIGRYGNREADIEDEREKRSGKLDEMGVADEVEISAVRSQGDGHRV